MQADFLTVEHNTGLDLENEFLLVGRKVKGEEHRNFTLHTFPLLAEYGTSYFHLISGARRLGIHLSMHSRCIHAFLMPWHSTPPLGRPRRADQG